MKPSYILTFTTVLLFNFSSYAQLVHCRPKICLIDYSGHDDRISNTDEPTIQSIKPDILIDNTPGGLWKGHCLPIKYNSLGIQVYSYIAGGYEGTKYHDDTDSLALNLLRVDAIYNDGAKGIFLDQVSNFPDSASKIYITAIYNECRAKDLKLIVNTGLPNFDPWLMSHCDFLLSDEEYNDTRKPTFSESAYLDRVLVASLSITSAAAADSVTEGARSKGFGYSYACDTYTALPSWLSSYMSLITHVPKTPKIALSADTLISNAQYGNQWYEKQLGLILGAVNQTYIPSLSGTFYDLITIDSCASDTSNNIKVCGDTSFHSKIKARNFLCYNTLDTLDASESTGGTPPYSFLWSSSDTSFKSTDQISSTGNLKMSSSYYLKVTDAIGCSDTANIYVRVNPALLAKSVASDSQLCYNSPAHLIGSGSYGGASPYQFFWSSNPYGFTANIADTNTDSLKMSKRFYLKITDSKSCSDTTSVFINVLAKLKQDTIAGIDTVCNSALSNWVYSVNGNPGLIYDWNTTGGAIVNGQYTDTITVNWNSQGNQSLSLLETDSNGCINSNSVAISVIPLPSARWAMNYNGDTAAFNAIDNTLPDTSYHWDFGDGNTETGRTVKHLYASNKSYSISLRVNNSNGCSNMFDTMVSVTKSVINTYVIRNLINIYPNPFNATTMVQYNLFKPSKVTLALFDITGKRLAVLLDKTQSGGQYTLDISAEKYNLYSGVYLLKFTTDDGYIERQVIKL